MSKDQRYFTEERLIFFVKKKLFLFFLLTQVGAYLTGSYLGLPSHPKDHESQRKAEFNFKGIQESGIIILVIFFDYLLKGFSRSKLGQIIYILALVSLGSYWQFRNYEFGILAGIDNVLYTICFVQIVSDLVILSFMVKFEVNTNNFHHLKVILVAISAFITTFFCITLPMAMIGIDLNNEEIQYDIITVKSIWYLVQKTWPFGLAILVSAALDKDYEISKYAKQPNTLLLPLYILAIVPYSSYITVAGALLCMALKKLIYCALNLRDVAESIQSWLVKSCKQTINFFKRILDIGF